MMNSTKVQNKTTRVIRSALVQMRTEYGPQGWWPVFCERGHCTNAEGVIEPDGYHLDQFDFPRTRLGRWEICCGAVLTQNTSWSNVRTALAGLRRVALMSPERILSAPKELLCEAIRPARYFNQKTSYLRAVSGWFIGNDRTLLRGKHSRPVLEAIRPELLKVLGVGRETADSILLYAYALPTFVVDAYTRRVFSQLGVLDATWSYERVRALLETVLVQVSPEKTVEYWQESHALIVEHARRLAARKNTPK
jgi:endonuclease-3 related protein